MMQPQIVPEEAISATLDEEIRRGLCVCFPPDVAVFSKTRKWHESGPAFSVILKDGPAVVAHVGVVDRTVEVDGRPLRAAGIQNVYVLPEFRKRGHADAVMVGAMREAGRQGYDAGLLFCIEELIRVYARTGWRTLEGVEVVCHGENGQDEPLPPKNLAMWYPLTTKELTARRIHLCGRDW